MPASPMTELTTFWREITVADRYVREWHQLTKEERSAVIRKGLELGLSATQMGAVVGKSRNVIIGHAHRNKIALSAAKASAGTTRQHTPRQPRQPQPRLPPRTAPKVWAPSKQEPIAAEEPVIEVIARSAELFIPVENRLTLLQLNEHTCKWPIGDPLTPDFYFCGGHSDEGTPYCEFHSRRAYIAVERRSKR